MDNNRKDQIRKDFETAWKEFKFYEKIYLSLSDNAKKHLKCQSIRYKKVLLSIQEIILPSVRNICPTCPIQCCKLYTPEPKIYEARSVGFFEFIDYLLVRCDTELPDSCYENAENNLCVFWKDGCILPADCRSYVCIRHFCDKLSKELDMQLIYKYLEEAKSILTNFSLREILI